MSPIPRETTNRPWRKPNTENELKSSLEVFGSNAMGNMHNAQGLDDINKMK